MDCATCHKPVNPDCVSSEGNCADCYNASVLAYRAARKAQLAAEPRCEVPRCKARGRWGVGPDRVLLCGRHLKIAKTNRVSAAGPLAIVAFLTQSGIDRASLLAFAQGSSAPQPTKAPLSLRQSACGYLGCPDPATEPDPYGGEPVCKRHYRQLMDQQMAHAEEAR